MNAGLATVLGIFIVIGVSAFSFFDSRAGEKEEKEDENEEKKSFFKFNYENMDKYKR